MEYMNIYICVCVYLFVCGGVCVSVNVYVVGFDRMSQIYREGFYAFDRTLPHEVDVIQNQFILNRVTHIVFLIKENGFKLTKERRWRYPAKTITDADYGNDIALLENAPAQAETQLHSLERAAAGISLYVNAQKTEYKCFNQTGDISTLNGSCLKLVDKFTYLGSGVSSTESDIDTRLAKVWTAIDRLSIVWKSDLTDKMKGWYCYIDALYGH